jgi:hypothetical protein
MFALGIMPNVRAGEGCTNANYEGSFGYIGTGTIVSGPNADPVAFVGRLTADGKGTFIGRDTISINGQIMPRTYTATYEVNEDCTGSYKVESDLGPVQGNLVIVNGGEEQRVIV